MGSKKRTVLRTAFDTYAIRDQRGAGATGEVFVAEDSEGVARAVKVLHATKTSPSGLKQAKDEFHFCFRGTHKNIVPVLDCGLTGAKAAFYVMPLYAHSLRDLMTQGIPPENVLRIFGSILDGVEAAHLYRIWHLDLKPENILTNNDGRDLVISDFGAAHFLEERLLASADAGAEKQPAEFPYAAPEQKLAQNLPQNMHGHALDGKADVYALGVILHEMFTGKTTIGLGHLDIGDVAPDFAYLDWTVGRMTNPEPARRLSVTEVKRELIARGNEFLSIQRLNALKTEVILESEVDDPFIRNPITIQAVDFKGEILYLTLSAPPPPNWVTIFREIGSYGSDASGSTTQGPEHFVFLGKLAHMRVSRRSDPQQLLDFAKSYVATANRLYAEWAVAAHRENMEQEREKRRTQVASARKGARRLPQKSGGIRCWRGCGFDLAQ